MQHHTTKQGLLEKSAWISLLLYTFILPFEKLIIVPGLGTLSRIVGFITLGIVGAQIVILGRLRRAQPALIAMYAFVTFNVVSVLWAEGRAFATVRSFTMFANFLLVIAYWEVITNRRELLITMKVYVLGAYVATSGIAFRALTGNVSTFQRRATLANTDENTVALVLAVGLPIAWYVATNRSVRHYSTRVEKVVMLAYIPYGYLGILFTASRGGLIGSLPFLFAIPFSISAISRKQRSIAVAGLVAMVAVAAFSAPSTSWKRIFETGEQLQDRDLSSRVGVWEDGVDLFFESPANMLIGVGNGNYQFIVGKVSHNTPLSVLVELGLIGAFVAAVAGFALWKALRTGSRGARLVWVTAFAIWGLAGLSLTLHWHKITWFLVAMALCHARIDSLRIPLDRSSSDSDTQLQLSPTTS